MHSFDEELMTAEFRRSPYAVYRHLREQAPVYWSEAWGAWLLTRYDDVVATLRDHSRFTSLGRLTKTMRPTVDEVLWDRIQPLADHYSNGMINVDPPDHTRIRSLVQPAFTPRRIAELEDEVRRIVDALLDNAADGGHMDVVADFAYPLPVTVIAAVLGLPAADLDLLKGWSDNVVKFMATARPSEEVLMISQEALLELRAYLSEVAARRRREPGDDLISALVGAEYEGEKLTEDELLGTLVSLLIGGHETTTSLIGGGTMLLLTHPEERRKLADDPRLMKRAIEEFLRYEGPFQRNRRIATTDVVIGDQRIAAGDLVMQLHGAANRDPEHFDDPERLDITRHPNRHVAFGFGPHFCIGASLARLEAPIALSALLTRIPEMNLDAEVETLQWENTVFRSLNKLPVAW